MIACAESLTVYTHYPTDLTHCFHNKLTFYYAPEIEDRGAYCFCPVCHSVIPSLCHSVIPSFCHSLWNFNLANNFWTVNARALIFHMSIPCDKTFLWVPLFWTLWPWPWSMTHFLKTLTLLITFEQWVLELWYFTWVSLVIRPFRVFHYVLPLLTFTLEFDPCFENFNLANNFWTVSAWALPLSLLILTFDQLKKNLHWS